MNRQKRKLTPSRVIGSVIAGLLIIIIVGYQIITTKPEHIEDVWQEILLIVLGIGFSLYIIINYFRQKNQ